MTKVSQSADQAIIAPVRVFLGHPHQQIFGSFLDSGPTVVFATLRAVELVGNELSVPTQDRLWFRYSSDFFQSPGCYA